jgi:hypothetical protein
MLAGSDWAFSVIGGGDALMLKEFYYQIKGKKGEGQFTGMSDRWVFPPIFSGKVEAKDKKEAKQIIENEYGKSFPLRVLQKDIDNNDYLLSITDMIDNNYLKSHFETRACLECKCGFRRIDLFNNINERYKGSDFCSTSCKEINYERKKIERFNEDNDLCGGISVIYKITNKHNDMCYIGQTTQSFTLRWWQHVKWGKSDCKFHQAIRESKITDWMFEVVHVCNNSKELNEMEGYFINKFDSIDNGYNTLAVSE